MNRMHGFTVIATLNATFFGWQDMNYGALFGCVIAGLALVIAETIEAAKSAFKRVDTDNA